MNDSQDLMDTILADLMAQPIPMPLWILFDCTVVADPQLATTTEREANFALTVANITRPSNTPRWHIVRVMADLDIGTEVWVSAEHISHDTAPANVRVSQGKPVNAALDCYPVRVVKIETDYLPY